MAILILVLFGVLGMVCNANNWFCIPDICIYICFAAAGIQFIFAAIQIVFFKRKFDNFGKRF